MANPHQDILNRLQRLEEENVELRNANVQLRNGNAALVRQVRALELGNEKVAALLAEEDVLVATILHTLGYPSAAACPQVNAASKTNLDLVTVSTARANDLRAVQSALTDSAIHQRYDGRCVAWHTGGCAREARLSNATLGRRR